MFAKIITGILAFLLLLFPNCGSLRYDYLMRTNTAAIAAPKIIAAVETRDISTLEAMMCQNIKQNVLDLQGEIGKLFDAIEGEITKSSWESPGSYQESNGTGKKISQAVLGIRFTTPSGTYFLGITWEISNSFAPEEVGIRGMGLLDPNGNLLFVMDATEGIGDWHN